MNDLSFNVIGSGYRRTSASARMLVLFLLLGVAHTYLHGQAEPTAIRAGDLQAGGTFSLGNSDYATTSFRGFGFYTTFDFRYHLGIEGVVHQINDSNNSTGIYERTYEVGPRYVFHYHRFRPYVRAMYGRGVFNFTPVGNQSTGKYGANVAFNLIAGGGGVDYRLRRSVTVRAGYEYQHWLGFLPNGLTPTMLELGAAYHFH
jgi:hypothetical protein